MAYKEGSSKLGFRFRLRQIAISISAALCVGVLVMVPVTAFAVTPGYYAPFGSISSNIECKVGHKFTHHNMQNGTCRVNWNTVISNAVNNAIDSSISGGLGNHLP